MRDLFFIFILISGLLSACATNGSRDIVYKNGVKCTKPANYEKLHNSDIDFKVQNILELKIKDDQQVERLIELSQDAQDIDAQEFRLCEAYGNGILDQSSYREYLNIILKWKTESKNPVEKKISQIMTDSPGGLQIAGNVTINNSGTINNTLELPAPKFNLKTISSNIPQDNLYKTEFLLTIESKVSVNLLYLEPVAPTVASFDVGYYQKTGMIMRDSGKRNGVPYKKIQNAYGSYLLTIMTNKPEQKIDIICKPL